MTPNKPEINIAPILNAKWGNALGEAFIVNINQQMEKERLEAELREKIASLEKEIEQLRANEKMLIDELQQDGFIDDSLNGSSPAEIEKAAG
jgi:hypothetical protein